MRNHALGNDATPYVEALLTSIRGAGYLAINSKISTSLRNESPKLTTPSTSIASITIYRRFRDTLKLHSHGNIYLHIHLRAFKFARQLQRPGLFCEYEHR